jgi:hypothetical protein
VRSVPLVLATLVHGTRITDKRTLTHIKNGGVQGRVGAGTPNLEGLALAPTTPTALARHCLQASCRRLRLLGALSQRALWRG